MSSATGLAEADPVGLPRRALRRARWELRHTRPYQLAGRLRHVADRGAFLRAQLLARDGDPRVWRLREGGAAVLRPGSRDVDVFDEVFVYDLYRPPPEVATVLARLGRPPRIADLGGHVGLATTRMLQLYPGARVRLFEPDPANLELLYRARDASPRPEAWDIRPVAAGIADGRMRFLAGRSADSREALPGEQAQASEVPVVDAFPEVAEADLLKIDIEGGEWALLSDARFTALPATAVVLEYHGYRGPPEGPYPAAHRLLHEAGYETRNLVWHPVGAGMLWAWRARPRGGVR